MNEEITLPHAADVLCLCDVDCNLSQLHRSKCVWFWHFIYILNCKKNGE